MSDTTANAPKGAFAAEWEATHKALGELQKDHGRLEGKIDVVNEKIDGVKGMGKVALYILLPFIVGIMGMLGGIITALP